MALDIDLSTTISIITLIILIPSCILLSRIFLKNKDRSALYLTLVILFIVIRLILQIVAQVLLSPSLAMIGVFPILPRAFLLVLTWKVKSYFKSIALVIVAVFATLVLFSSVEAGAIVIVEIAGQATLTYSGTLPVYSGIYYRIFYLALILFGFTDFRASVGTTNRSVRWVFLMGGCVLPLVNFILPWDYASILDAVCFLLITWALLKDPLLRVNAPSKSPKGEKAVAIPPMTPPASVSEPRSPILSPQKDPIEQLKGIMRVTKRLDISRMAQLLDMPEEDLWKRIVPWAQEFGFTIDKNEVEFQTGQVDAFVSELEKQFKSWGKSGKQH